jgi:beta-N-acetylhexosaminidase
MIAPNSKEIIKNEWHNKNIMRSWKISAFFLLACCISLSCGSTVPPIAMELGQNLIVGIQGTALDEGTIKLLNYIKPAGIVLFRKNYKSDLQFRSLIAHLQKISNKDTGHPYFIMIDEEPAGAMRIGLFRNIFTAGKPNWDGIERNIMVLAGTGVNVDLAPIADFPFTSEAFIARRVPVKNVGDLLEFNSRFIALLKKHGISATLKHFPGMGTFVANPHHETVSVDMDGKMLEASLGIFKDGIDSGADLVMTNHGTYRNIDPEYPVTFSSHIVTGLLKKRLDFRGLVITDDLSGMPLGGSRDKKLADAGLEALKAGHHMVMFSRRLEKTKGVFDEMLAKIEADPELRKIIRKNHNKVIKFKSKMRTAKEK